MIQATKLRRGNIILHKDELFRVVEFHHLTPGNKRGMMQTKLKNLRSGAISDHKFRSDDSVEKAVLDKREMEYLYSEDQSHYFMDTETYDQIQFGSETLGDAMRYLVANSMIEVEFYDEKPVGIELPPTVDLKIVETEPGLRSATVSNVLKPATIRNWSRRRGSPFYPGRGNRPHRYIGREIFGKSPGIISDQRATISQ